MCNPDGNNLIQFPIIRYGFSSVNAALCDSTSYINPSIMFEEFKSRMEMIQTKYLCQMVSSMPIFAFPMPDFSKITNNAPIDQSQFGGLWGSMGLNLTNTNPLNPFAPITNQNNNNNNGNNSNLSASEKEYKEKADKLKDLINLIKNSNELKDTETLKDLNKALNEYTKDSKEELEADKTSGTSKKYERQYNRLKKAYDEIPLAIRKSAFEEKINNNFVPNKKVLSMIGYESVRGTNSHLEADLQNMTIKLDTDKISNPKLEDLQVIGQTRAKNNTYPILDTVSCWNSKFKNRNNNQSLIKYLASKYEIVDGTTSDKKKENKKIFKDEVIAPFVYSLVDSAKEVIDAKNIEGVSLLTNDEKKTFNKLIENIEKNFKNNSWTELSSNFDKLYVKVRLAKAEQLKEKVLASWKLIDDDKIFNKNLFVGDTKEDLKNEGFENLLKDAPKMNSTAKTSSSASTTATEETSAEEVTGNSDSKKQEKTQTKTEVKELLEEIKEIDKNLVTCTNGVYSYKFNGTTHSFGFNKDGKMVINKKLATEEQISEILEQLQKFANISKDDSYATKNAKIKMLTNPEDAGKQFCKDAVGHTNVTEYNRMKNYIELIDKDNVVKFLKGYKDENHGFNFGEGFFEQIANEGTQIMDFGKAREIIEYFLDAIKAYDLTSVQEHVEDLEELLDAIKDKSGNLKDGDCNSALDDIDDNIEDILDGIKNQIK